MKLHVLGSIVMYIFILFYFISFHWNSFIQKGPLFEFCQEGAFKVKLYLGFLWFIIWLIEEKGKIKKKQ